MGVVDLYHRVIGQVAEGAAPFDRLVQDILRRAADHEILLVDAQLPAVAVAVIGIQEQGQIVEDVLLVKGDPLPHNGFVHNLSVEEVQADRLVLIAGHVHVVHGGLQREAPEGHHVGDGGGREPAGGLRPAGLREPWIGIFLLEVVLEGLSEEAQVVVQADSLAGKPHCGDGVQEAGGQTAQPAVTQRGLRLRLLNLRQGFPVFLQEPGHLVIEPQVDEVVGQKLSRQELRRDIVQFFPAVVIALVMQPSLDVEKQRLVQLLVGALAALLAGLFQDKLFQLFHIVHPPLFFGGPV